MMKCWTKKIDSKLERVWDSNNGERVLIRGHRKGWESYVYGEGQMNIKSKINRDFKTKSQALKFANKYMKKNDRC